MTENLDPKQQACLDSQYYPYLNSDNPDPDVAAGIY